MKTIFTFLGCTIIFFISAQERPSTASINVHVIERAFDMPGLDRKRRIRLYLPPSYKQSDQAYPVIYMHDGQNLFDDATSIAVEWGVDEILNEIANEGGPEFIVVGIDNGGSLRTEELTPFPNEKYGGGKGQAYMEFIVNVIKPFVDDHYRTKSDLNNTAIIGSSLGGLVSHYAIYKYPEVFAKAGIYSPSYWFSYDEMLDFTLNHPLPVTHKLNLLVGKKEGESMYVPFQQMVDEIKNVGHPSINVNSAVIEDGEHNERFWRSEFKASILWLFVE
jgi:predicted alpha/beta superfamily hydrolase